MSKGLPLAVTEGGGHAPRITPYRAAGEARRPRLRLCYQNFRL